MHRGKRYNMVKSLMLLGMAAVVCSGQAIDISGIVLDSGSGAPVAGLVVSLSNAGVKDTTDENGTFTLKRSDVSIAGHFTAGVSATPVIFHNNGVVTISVGRTERVLVRTYSMQGRLMHCLTETIEKGRHIVRLPQAWRGACVHHIMVGALLHTITTVGTTDGVAAGALSAANDVEGLGKRAAGSFIDTLSVRFSGKELIRLIVAQPQQKNLLIRIGMPKPCAPPLSSYPTGNSPTVVGNGTAASCTEAALRAAISKRGVITFNCGPEPVTITLTQQLDLSGSTDIIIDGGGRVSLDGNKKVRHFYYSASNWMVGNVKVVLQRLTLRNGNAPHGQYYPQDPQAPKCAYGYKEGSGGSIFIRDGVLHVIDCAFYNNHAALVGPDVGGGAIYAMGARQVIISGCLFRNNRASNGGAVAMLFANPGIYNTVFENNTAEGIGMNYVEQGCPGLGHENQGGAGGLGGAVYFDGMNNDGIVYTLCGCTFINNRCNELGGALFRTPNEAMREMLIDRCTFDGNTARMGSVSFIKQNAVTVRASLFSNNTAGRDVKGASVGGNLGFWVNTGSVNIENSTFYRNSPGINVEGNASTVTNCTFVQSPIAGPLTLNNCIFQDMSCASSAFAGANNIQWPSGNACASGTNFINPMLGPLADNGGPTLTCLPGVSASAIAVGQGCPATDQRGRLRSSSRCCVGAVEIE